MLLLHLATKVCLQQLQLKSHTSNQSILNTTTTTTTTLTLATTTVNKLSLSITFTREPVHLLQELRTEPVIQVIIAGLGLVVKIVQCLHCDCLDEVNALLCGATYMTQCHFQLLSGHRWVGTENHNIKCQGHEVCKYHGKN